MGEYREARWEVKSKIYRNGRLVHTVESGEFEGYGEALEQANYWASCGITDITQGLGGVIGLQPNPSDPGSVR